jgi:hypothetical protein
VRPVATIGGETVVRSTADDISKGIACFFGTGSEAAGPLENAVALDGNRCTVGHIEGDTG